MRWTGINMKRIALLAAALIAAVAVLVAAAPASANSIPTTGSQLRLFGPVTTFPTTPVFRNDSETEAQHLAH